MTARLPLLFLAAAALVACRSTPDVPDMPDAPQVVHTTVTEYVVPEWLIKPLPEDAPKANTPQEATRLACVRLGTIQVANCRFRLGAALRQGKAIDAEDIAACQARAVAQCEVSP